MWPGYNLYLKNTLKSFYIWVLCTPTWSLCKLFCFWEHRALRFFFSFHLTVLYITLKNSISSSALHSFHTWDYNCPNSPASFSLSTFMHSLWNHNLTPTITFVQLSKGFPKTSLWFVMEEPVVMIFTFLAFIVWDTLWREGRMLIGYHRW